MRYIKNNMIPKAIALPKVPLENLNKPENQIAINSTAFPFNSQVVSEKKYTSFTPRLWLSSSSHGADGHGIDNQFPNLICKSLQIPNCYLLNQSKAGTLIEYNTKQIINYGAVWKPQYTILYQMTMDIANLSRTIQPKTNELSTPKILYEDRPTLSSEVISFFEIDKYFKNLSLYIYPREFLGSVFLLQTQLKNSLPVTDDEEFTRRINKYIDASLDIDATPVLITFLSAHSYQNKRPIPWRMQTWSLIWDEKLSPRGLVDTIDKYNHSLRRIAQTRNIYLIDLEKIWGKDSRKEYFDDFVHFNIDGHKRVANIIATKLKTIM